MRVLFVHTGADLYGASRSLLRLTSRMAKEGHALLVLLPYDGPLTGALKSAGVQVQVEDKMFVLTRLGVRHKVKLPGFAMSLCRSVIRMRRIIKNFQPDIVHTNTAVTLSPGIAARLCGVPHLWHIREFFEDFPRLWSWYQELIVMFSDRIACVSGAVEQQFKPKNRLKTVVIHNGFPQEEFPPADPERVRQFRNCFMLNTGRTVGLVGRIKFGRKGQDVFVQAAAKIKDRFPDTKFLCIGSPFPGNEDHLDRLLHLVEELKLGDQFVYTGDVDDIKAAYAALDISVLASAQPEPFGGVVIESMAMGLPVIGTALGGTVEQIEHGMTGYVVPPDDPQAMADAISKMLDFPELRTRFGKAGRQRFLSEFEFEAFYQQMLLHYDSLIQNKKLSAHA
jgi:glycosyltransferase involved in cell wall biosynthesis